MDRRFFIDANRLHRSLQGKDYVITDDVFTENGVLMSQLVTSNAGDVIARFVWFVNHTWQVNLVLEREVQVHGKKNLDDLTYLDRYGT